MTHLPTLERTLASVTVAECDAVDLRQARRVYATHRGQNGFAYTAAAFLTAPDGNAKIARSTVPTWSLFLAPAESSGTVNVCPWATTECIALCLNTAGRATFDPAIGRARRCKTTFAAAHPAMFLALLRHELRRVQARRRRHGVRLNGTSDIRWERVPAIAPLIGRGRGTWYDYTKAPPRARAARPAAYDLTYSVSERWTDAAIGTALDRGERVALIARGMPEKGTPVTWHGADAVDGDLSDYRPADGAVVVMLRPKGQAKRHATGGMVRSYV